MNKTIYDLDLTRMLPPSLKADEKMLSLAKVIGNELQQTAQMAKLNIIYARIDELEEEVLDILAYDLHVDWYDYSYPVEAKRALLKDSVKVHKRLGTKFAVETALGNLHPNSYIEEWFQYNGEPFSFRVVLDTTYSRAGAGYFEIKKAIDGYKRKSAHMDDLIYQCTVKMEIVEEAKGFCYKTDLTGKVITGTTPYRNTIGITADTNLEIHNEASGHMFVSSPAGTKPYRNIIAGIENKDVEQMVVTDAYKYNVKRCGTSLCRS